MSVACSAQEWTPSENQWETIQRRSLARPAEVTVLGVRRTRPGGIRSSGRISISTSPDEVGAPIFYREVNLPFRDAVNDPSQIRWRFGDVTSRQPPPVVLKDLPVCGNCHSFSADGTILGMDVDYANDKGSYAIVPVGQQMVLEPSKIITWSDYKRKDGEATFGLLSQVSPDGKYVASTVKDGSVFVATPDLAFSQLFFPIKGIVGIYSREDGTFRALPGADDPQYVQSNPVWSPDGKWIVFARSKRYRTEGDGAADAGRMQGVHSPRADVPLRSVPHPLQRRPGRQGGTAGRGIAERDEQLLRPLFAGRQVDRVLPGERPLCCSSRTASCTSFPAAAARLAACAATRPG